MGRSVVAGVPPPSGDLSCSHGAVSPCPLITIEETPRDSEAATAKMASHEAIQVFSLQKA
jgi:hypothetical protein